MLRTRDYFLLLVTIVFLVVAIGSTLIVRSYSSDSEEYRKITLVPENDTEYTAVVVDDVDAARAGRLAAMRKQIEDGANLFIYESTESEPEEEVNEEQSVEDMAELRCASYSAYAGTWSAAGIKFAETEGIRLVYRDSFTPEAQTASTTAQQTQRDVLLELPMRGLSLGQQNCISSDVIGVTVGGTLIRNSQAQLFAPTAEGTLIGYALDGYPIYGTTANATDACGGRTVLGQYRYQLSPDRDTIINCYAGQPVKI